MKRCHWIIFSFCLLVSLPLQASEMKLLFSEQKKAEQAVAFSLQKKLPTKIVAVSSPGTMESLMMVSLNLSDLTFSPLAYLLDLKKQPKYRSLENTLKIVLPLYQEEIHILVRKDSQIQSLSDLMGKRVCLGPKNSPVFLCASKVLEKAGLSLGSILVDHSNSAQAMKKLSEGELDGMFFLDGKPSPFLQSLSSEIGDQILLLNLGEQMAEELSTKAPLYYPCRIPAKTYSFQKEDVYTLSIRSVLVARQNISSQEIFSLCEKIFENQKELLSFHPKWKEVHLYEGRNLLRRGLWPFHQGSQEYFLKESMKGSLKILSHKPTKKSFYTLGQDIERACAERGIHLQHLPSEGSGQNILSLVSGKTQMALIQMDSLIFMQKSPIQKALDHLYFLMPLHDEPIHILVHKNSLIQSIPDIKGKKIFCGAPASETFLTASYLFALYNMSLRYSIQRDYSSPEEALDKLVQGDLDGMILIGNDPLPLLKKLSSAQTQNLQFLSLSIKNLPLPKNTFFPYSPATISSSHYPWLKKDIETLSVPCVLLCSAEISSLQGKEILQAILDFSPQFQDPANRNLSTEKIRDFFISTEIPIPLHPSVYEVFTLKKGRLKKNN